MYLYTARRAVFFMLLLASAAQAADTGAREIWAEAQISETRPYVQQTLIYMVLVVSRASLSIVDPQPPVLASVSLERLDEQPLNYPVNFKGKRYQVTAFRYALTPLTFGAIELPPAKLKVTYASQQQWSGPAPPGKQIELSTNKLALDSRPPASDQQPWLPLYALRLNGKLDKGLIARVGEPLTLTLTQNATGASGEQLPSLAALLDNLPDFKVYPERAQTSQEVVADENLLFLSGKRVENFTLIPQRAGSLHLPAIQMNWWNVRENKEMRVEWAGQELMVADSGTPAPTAAATQPAQEVSLGTGLSLPWQLALNLVLFLLGLWIGAGHPGTARARRVLRQAWEAARPGLQWLRRQMGALFQFPALEPLRQWAKQRSARRPAAGAPVRRVAPEWGGRWLPGRLQAIRLLRAVDAATTPARICQALGGFAQARLRSPPNLPLRALVGVYCRAYSRLDREAVADLFGELEQVMYAGQHGWDIHAWKDRFDEQFGGLLFRAPRLAHTAPPARGLPALNPVA